MSIKAITGCEMTDFYIGLMSGTSVDGIDAIIVDFTRKQPKVAATYFQPYDQALRNQILELCKPGPNEIQRLGELDVMLGKAFANAVNHILKRSGISASYIKAIGSHGQTVRHHPHSENRFTLQIGDPNVIAAKTGITTIADFRRKDLAWGGQGAPLVPAFHNYILRSKDTNRAIVNIGGIANATLLDRSKPKQILGFDTGPGNTLCDAWIYYCQQQKHDERGNWAASGKADSELLAHLLADPYFSQTAPKSTGREHFNLEWLQQSVEQQSISTKDIQATLVELTAVSIVDAVKKHLPSGEMLICGGGVHNDFLMRRLKVVAQPEFKVFSTQKYGIDPDWVEAMAFAWLAQQTLKRAPGNVPSVTGAETEAVLGGVYFA